jgi:hypothetical protein
MSIDGISGPMPATEYKINDRISFSGAEGTILDIETDPYAMLRDYPIHVLMDTGMHLHFTHDGKFMSVQTDPVITVTGSIRPKVKKYRFVVRRDNSQDWWLTSDSYSMLEAQEEFESCQYSIIEDSEIEVDE